LPARNQQTGFSKNSEGKPSEGFPLKTAEKGKRPFQQPNTNERVFALLLREFQYQSTLKRRMGFDMLAPKVPPFAKTRRLDR
jgi:hypothetical protein